MRDEDGAEGGEQEPGGTMVNPLTADPDSPARKVESNQPPTVCP